MAHQPYAPGLRNAHAHYWGEGSEYLLRQVHEPQAVWSEQPDAGASALLDQFYLCGSAGLACFRKAGGEQHYATDRRSDRFVYGRLHQRCRYGHDGKIDLPGDFGDARIGRQPLDLVRFGVDRKDLPLIAVLEQERDRQPTDLRRRGGGADDGDRSRP